MLREDNRSFNRYLDFCRNEIGEHLLKMGLENKRSGPKPKWRNKRPKQGTLTGIRLAPPPPPFCTGDGFRWDWASEGVESIPNNMDLNRANPYVVAWKMRDYW